LKNRAGARSPTLIVGVGPYCASRSAPVRTSLAREARGCHRRAGFSVLSAKCESLARAAHVPVHSPFTDDAAKGPAPVCSRLLRVGELIHGHLGWLAAASLMHPAVLLRRTKRSAHLSVGLAVGLVTVAGALGVALYGPYRDALKQPIFASAPAVGYIFERKEHLAFGAILFAWAGTVAYVGASPRSALHEPLRKAAHWAFVAAAGLALLSAAMGTIVASYRTF
jgi:hypothetical protein